MAISVQCACGARYRVPDSAMGKHVRCKKCGDKFVIPLLEKVEESVPLSELGALPPGAAIEPPRPPAGVSVSATPAVGSSVLNLMPVGSNRHRSGCCEHRPSRGNRP